jgi:hypothetical protein
MQARDGKTEQGVRAKRESAVKAVGRWWLRGWLEFTSVVGGGPEYLGGPRPVCRSGRDVGHGAR